MHWLGFLSVALLFLLAEYCTFRWGWVEGFRKGWKQSLDYTMSIFEAYAKSGQVTGAPPGTVEFDLRSGLPEDAGPARANAGKQRKS
jgi:hypothetical protein